MQREQSRQGRKHILTALPLLVAVSFLPPVFVFSAAQLLAFFSESLASVSPFPRWIEV